MCLILFALHQHAEYPLVVIANRDEYYARPSRDAHWWDDTDIYAGRDLEAGGTWLGVNQQGRFAAVTNVRESGTMQPGKRSRGELTRDFLATDTSVTAYLQRLQERDQAYAGFNLLVGDARELWFYSNRERRIRRIEAGVYGVSNGEFDEPWPKLKSGREELAAQLAGSIEHDRLMDILTDQQIAADHDLPSTGVELDIERLLSSRFIRSPSYGTRACTAVTFAGDGRIEFSERNYIDAQQPGASRRERFTCTS